MQTLPNLLLIGEIEQVNCKTSNDVSGVVEQQVMLEIAFIHKVVFLL